MPDTTAGEPPVTLRWDRGSPVVEWEWQGHTVTRRHEHPVKSAAVVGEPPVVVIVEAIEESAPRNAVVVELDGTERVRLEPPPARAPIGFDQVFASGAGIEAVFATRDGDLHGEPDLVTGRLRDVREWR